MSDQTRHDAARHAKDESRAERAGQDSFPASDPTGTAPTAGSRAFPPEAMLEGSTARPETAGATLSFRFADSETAKLALEAAVREGPIDRRLAEIALDDDRVTLRVDMPPADRPRIAALLKRHGAME